MPGLFCGWLIFTQVIQQQLYCQKKELMKRGLVHQMTFDLMKSKMMIIYHHTAYLKYALRILSNEEYFVYERAFSARKVML